MWKECNMANQSLDDYMGKKNFRVKFQNNYVQQNAPYKQKVFPNKFGLSTKKNLHKGIKFQNKMNNLRGPLKRDGMATRGVLSSAPIKRKLNKPIVVTGLGNVKGFDARQKLSGNTKTGGGPTSKADDARQKIITAQKQKGTFDARSRIKAKLDQEISVKDVHVGNGNNTNLVKSTNMVKLGASGGLSRTINTGSDGTSRIQMSGKGGLTKTIRTGGGVQLGGVGGLKKTLKNEFANGGSQIEMFGNSIQITRSVPNSQVTFDGRNKLTITKKASSIRDTRPIKRTRSPISWTSLNDVTSPSPPKRANMIKTYKAADAIQSAAVRAAAERLKIPQTTVVPAPKRTIPVITTSRQEVHVLTAKRRTTQQEIIPKPPPQPVRMKTKSVYRPVTVKQEQPDIPPVTTPAIYEANDGVDYLLSPLQGYKVTVTNLDAGVSQDDLIELFGAIGALKRAKISRPGLGEVVYVKKDDAQKAALKYHNRELDGLPMQVKMVTPLAARIQQVASDDDTTGPSIPDSLKFPKASQAASIVDVPLIHKALFKTGTTVSAKPVTFTVKI